MNKVTLRNGRERSVLRRHPWIFSGAVESGSAAPGEIVEVCSASGATLGYGAFSPQSQIRVRMLAFGAGNPPGDDFVRAAVEASVARRRLTAPWLFDSSAADSAARLVNAEGDGLPGVVADFYSGWVVCQLTSAFAESRRELIADALMRAVPGCRGVCSRSDADTRVKEGLGCSDSLEVLPGEPPPELIEIREGPAAFFVDVRKGHKTGFYLDQRDARATVGALAAGRSVLNCFCYTGGFGIYAGLGGASSVVQVDVSVPALDLARRNWEASGGAGRCEMDFVEADVFQYLRRCRDSGRKFDMIVLDPPKFAESKAQVMKAARGYKDINLLAMKLLSPGGILATFSCSGAMTSELFDTVLAEAAADAKRDFQIIARTGHAPDHPVSLSFPEGRYLKGVVLGATD